MEGKRVFDEVEGSFVYVLHTLLFADRGMRVGDARSGSDASEHIFCRGDGAIAVLAGDVEVGDEANGVRADGAGENAVRAKGGNGGGSVAHVAEGEDDDVALHGVEVDFDIGDGRDGFGEQAGVGVIFVEACGHLLEGDETGGGEDAGLAHAAAEGLADGSSAVDIVLGSDEHGADRSAESFRQAEVDGGEAAGDLGDGQVEGRCGVEDAGSVEMDGEAGLLGAGPDCFQGVEWGHGAAGHVVRVFDADETGGGAIVDLGRDGGREVLPGEDAARSGDGAEGAAGEVRHHAHLPIEDVGAGLTEDLLPMLGVELDGDLVAPWCRWERRWRLRARRSRRAERSRRLIVGSSE